jgi:LmbE family N-acetylglucosaminyl deacetylase
MQTPRVLVLGAHPDDADLKAGGCAALWHRAGVVVKLVSVTDGGAGHHTLRGAELSRRRRAEAKAAGALVGADYEVLDFPDGGLLPTLEARHAIIRLIRSFRPDLVLTHRRNDYHPDHRYTSTLVQDAAYLVTVPAVCPDVPHLARDPVFAYLSDEFTRPLPFRPDVVVDVGGEVETVVGMLDCHVSQFYEWLPYSWGVLDQVPAGAEERRRWLAKWYRDRVRPLADHGRRQLIETYGDVAGRRVELAEAFEVSEYGSPLDEAARARLFPFLPPRRPDEAAAGWSDLRDDE